MGEVAVQLSLEHVLSPEHVFPSGVDLERGNTIGVGEKIFVIGGTDSGKTLNDVQIFYESSGKWVTPTVMGTGPINLKDQHAVVLSKERILILQPNDVTWFLEVDTPFVREQKKKLNVELVAWSKGVIGDFPRPIVITGPSGVGKGTLISKLMKEFPSTFGFSVSHTTRNPREKEQNGVHYHFTERRVMEKDISQGKFLESANVHGNLYGTSIEAVEVVSDAGKRCILEIDVQGAKSVRASSLDALFLFIGPPSFEELENRLRNRGTETVEQIQKRLTNARGELEQGLSSGIFDHVLVNSDLETCYEDLKKLLGLTDEVSQKTLPSMKSVVLPANFSVILGDKKVFIQSVNHDLGRNITYMLDLSSLKGGAPGRTKGLKFLEISAEEVQNGNVTN